MIRAVLLDAGNVVTFFDHDRACRALAALGSGAIDPDRVRERVFTCGLALEFDCGRIATPAFIARLKTVCGIDAGDADVARAWADIFTPNPSVTDLLPRLRRTGLRLVLASNTNALHFEWMAERQPAVVAAFDALALSYRIGAVKPSRVFYDACLRLAAARPDQCLFIDDNPAYVEAASEIGIAGRVYTPSADIGAFLADHGVTVAR